MVTHSDVTIVFLYLDSIFHKEFDDDSIFSPPIFGVEDINSSARSVIGFMGCKTHSVTSCTNRRSLQSNMVLESSHTCYKKIMISIPFNFPQK